MEDRFFLLGVIGVVLLVVLVVGLGVFVLYDIIRRRVTYRMGAIPEGRGELTAGTPQGQDFRNALVRIQASRHCPAISDDLREMLRNGEDIAPGAMQLIERIECLETCLREAEMALAYAMKLTGSA